MFNSKVFTTLMVLLIVLAAGTALAGDMTYKVYGKLHTSINMLNDGNESGFSLTSNTSRFGIKGGYELNENFTAIWQFEQSLNMAQKGGSKTYTDDNGDEVTIKTNNGLANRNTFIGLKGDWGTFLGGIHDTPVKTLGRKATFFKDTVGDFRDMTMGHDMRVENVLVYVLPAMENGFGGQFAHVLDSSDWTNPDAEGASAFSGMVYYAPEDFFLGLGYETLSAGFFDGNDDGVTDAEAEGVLRGAGRYNAEKFGVAALYQAVSNVRGVDGVSATTIGFEGLFKAAPKWHVKAAYYMTDPNTDVDDDGYNKISFGVDHPVTKAVTFYAQYAIMSNDDNAMAPLGNNGWTGMVYPSMDDGGMAESATGASVGGYLKF